MYLKIEGNLKIIVYYLKQKNAEEIMTDHKGARMVMDGED